METIARTSQKTTQGGFINATDDTERRKPLLIFEAEWAKKYPSSLKLAPRVARSHPFFAFHQQVRKIILHDQMH